MQTGERFSGNSTCAFSNGLPRLLAEVLGGEAAGQPLSEALASVALVSRSVCLVSRAALDVQGGRGRAGSESGASVAAEPLRGGGVGRPSLRPPGCPGTWPWGPACVQQSAALTWQCLCQELRGPSAWEGEVVHPALLGTAEPADLTEATVTCPPLPSCPPGALVRRAHGVTSVILLYKQGCCDDWP